MKTLLSSVLVLTLLLMHLKDIDGQQGGRERRSSYRDPEYIKVSGELRHKLKNEYNVGNLTETIKTQFKIAITKTSIFSL